MKKLLLVLVMIGLIHGGGVEAKKKHRHHKIHHQKKHQKKSKKNVLKEETDFKTESEYIDYIQAEHMKNADEWLLFQQGKL